MFWNKGNKLKFDSFQYNLLQKKKFGLFLYLDNLEQTVASYRGRTRIKFSRNTLRSNLRSMRNTQVIHDANHFKWFVKGPDIIIYIKIIKYIFSMIIFFREMSNKLIPMEVEEAACGGGGDFQGTRKTIICVKRRSSIIILASSSPSSMHLLGGGSCCLYHKYKTHDMHRIW